MNHKQASMLAATSPCAICGSVGFSVPAHFPTHRGMGGRKDFWDSDKWVPLCGGCHELVDGRAGASTALWNARQQARRQLYSLLEERCDA
jgi:hypothetical protein